MTNVIYISFFFSYVSDEHGEERNDKVNQVRVDPSGMKQEQIINYHCDFYNLNLESTRISLLYTVTSTKKRFILKRYSVFLQDGYYMTDE